MNVLCCDTASAFLTVGLEKGAKFFLANTSSSMQHSENLMNCVLSLMKEAGLELTDIDVFACLRGPGSFTGLRIGLACFKGLAMGAGKGVVSVSSLEAYARSCGLENNVISCIDAKKKRWYLAQFEDGKRILEDTDGTPADLKIVPGKSYVVCGPDAQAFCTILSSLFPDCCFEVSPYCARDVAKAIIDLAKEAPGFDHIGQGPLYLRKSDAEEALELKRKEQANDRL